MEVLFAGRAPFAGEIVERSAVRGALVEGGKSLFTLADRSVMWAMLNRVPYKTVAHLVYTRERISAARAEALGLVTQLVAPAALASTPALLRRMNFLSRYVRVGEQASTGSQFKYRSTSSAKVLAVS